jgi:thioredoxin 1
MTVDRIGVTLTDQNFRTTVLASRQPVLVVFWAEWCGPWHMIAPAVAALAEAFRGQVTTATLDVEAHPQTPQRYGIRTLPTLLFVRDGQVVDQLIGVVARADIAAKLQALTRTGRGDHAMRLREVAPREGGETALP